MRPIRTAILILICATGARGQVDPAANPPLTITFERTAVVVSGVQGKHPMLFFSMAVEQGEFDSALVRREHLVNDTADERARFEISTGVPRRSVWFAIDTKTGDYAVASPPTFPLRQIAFPADIIRYGAANEPDALQLGFGSAEVLIVRPDGGIWGDSPARGGAHDAMNGRGRLTVPLNLVRRIGTAQDAGRITPADLIVVIEPNSLAFFVGHASR